MAAGTGRDPPIRLCHCLRGRDTGRGHDADTARSRAGSSATARGAADAHARRDAIRCVDRTAPDDRRPLPACHRAIMAADDVGPAHLQNLILVLERESYAASQRLAEETQRETALARRIRASQEQTAQLRTLLADRRQRSATITAQTAEMEQTISRFGADRAQCACARRRATDASASPPRSLSATATVPMLTARARELAAILDANHAKLQKQQCAASAASANARVARLTVRAQGGIREPGGDAGKAGTRHARVACETDAGRGCSGALRAVRQGSGGGYVGRTAIAPVRLDDPAQCRSVNCPVAEITAAAQQAQKTVAAPAQLAADPADHGMARG